MAMPPAPAAEFRGRRLLLVEDHPVNREIVLALLETTEIAIEIAVNGREAVARAEHTPYDVILMDVQMPVMDGMAATRAIRKFPMHVATPIVAMTADARADDRSRYLAAGMNDFIAKPFEPAVLLKTLRKWISAPATPPAAKPAHTPAPLGSEDAGIDFAHGMLIAHGKPERYHLLLNEFARESVKDVAQLRANVLSRQWAEARRASHSLRGAAALVGATRLQALVHELEQAVGEQAQARHLEELLDAIAAANAALGNYLASIVPPAHAVPDGVAAATAPVPMSDDDEAQALSALSVLAELLGTGDMRSNRVLNEAIGPITAYLGGAAETLRQQIDRYDYEGATETLRQALSRRRG